jgi:hypothetical protein
MTNLPNIQLSPHVWCLKAQVTLHGTEKADTFLQQNAYSLDVFGWHPADVLKCFV